ncbi:MAG: hypothetical protein U9R38_02760 [Candidatus Margulisiibacteriota bacterium]|nr:hypothetical protein [Candidatus Margulisiibacteriota bacterium]
MKLNLNLLFPNNPSYSRARVIARMAEIKKALSSRPAWLLGQKGGSIRCVPRKREDREIDALDNYHNYRSEKDLSSTVQRESMFIFPQRSTGIRTFQLFSKSKERKSVLQVWEFLMLDLWSHVLRHYTEGHQIILSAPQPYMLKGETLHMAYKLGTIGAKLAQDYKSSYQVPLPSGNSRLYHAFALHLGALACVKETEGLLHGDYKLRHLLFDPGNQTDAFSFIIVNTFGILTGGIPVIEPFLSMPSLNVVDLEHSLRAPKTEVQKENEKMLTLARHHTSSHGLRPSDFEKAYGEGYDLISPQNVIQTVVDQQYERWGFSVDTSF